MPKIQSWPTSIPLSKTAFLLHGKGVRWGKGFLFLDPREVVSLKGNVRYKVGILFLPPTSFPISRWDWKWPRVTQKDVSEPSWLKAFHTLTPVLLLGQVPCSGSRSSSGFTLQGCRWELHVPQKGFCPHRPTVLGLCKAEAEGLFLWISPKSKGLVLVSFYWKGRKHGKDLTLVPLPGRRRLRPSSCSPLHVASSLKGMEKRAVATDLGQQLHNSPQGHRAAWNSGFQPRGTLDKMLAWAVFTTVPPTHCVTLKQVTDPL